MNSRGIIYFDPAESLNDARVPGTEGMNEQGNAKAVLDCSKIGISLKALDMLQAESLDQHSQLDIGVPCLAAPNKHPLLHIFSNGRIPLWHGRKNQGLKRPCCNQ